MRTFLDRTSQKADNVPGHTLEVGENEIGALPLVVPVEEIGGQETLDRTP